VSIKVMTWVWDHSRAKGSQHHVLLAIADCASDDGSNAFPSMAELVRKTRLSERAVQSSIRKLVALGELFVSTNGGPRGCNRYRVIMETPQNLHPADSAGVQEMHPAESAPPQKSTAPPARSAPGTVLEPSKNSSSKSSRARTRGTRIPDDFAVTDEMRAWAKENVPHLAGAGETEKFIDYWRAQPGQRGVKLDWPATWRNWMRRAAERHQPGNALVPTSGSKPSTTDQRVAAGLQLAAELKRRREEAT
jgi:hypothetical protein